MEITFYDYRYTITMPILMLGMLWKHLSVDRVVCSLKGVELVLIDIAIPL